MFDGFVKKPFSTAVPAESNETPVNRLRTVHLSCHAGRCPVISCHWTASSIETQKNALGDTVRLGQNVPPALTAKKPDKGNHKQIEPRDEPPGNQQQTNEQFHTKSCRTPDSSDFSNEFIFSLPKETCPAYCEQNGIIPSATGPRGAA